MKKKPLTPSVDLAFGFFPAAEDIYIWACDPGEIYKFSWIPRMVDVNKLEAAPLPTGF